MQEETFDAVTRCRIAKRLMPPRPNADFTASGKETPAARRSLILTASVFILVEVCWCPAVFYRQDKCTTGRTSLSTGFFAVNWTRPQETFAKRLRRLREEMGERLGKKVRQEDLADLAGVARTAVVGWEGGVREPTLQNLLSLAKVFNLSLSELLEGLQESDGNGIHSVGSDWKPEELTDTPALVLITEVEAEIDPSAAPDLFLAELYRRAFARRLPLGQMNILDNRRSAIYRKEKWQF